MSFVTEDPDRPAAILDCIDAWLDYQVASQLIGPSDVVLVTDGERRYVRTSSDALGLLGFDPVGRRIDDLVPAGDAAPAELWTTFVAGGRMDGVFRLVDPSGRVIPIRYHAVADAPFAGYHSSRITVL